MYRWSDVQKHPCPNRKWWSRVGEQPAHALRFDSIFCSLLLPFFWLSARTGPRFYPIVLHRQRHSRHIFNLNFWRGTVWKESNHASQWSGSGYRWSLQFPSLMWRSVVLMMRWWKKFHAQKKMEPTCSWATCTINFGTLEEGGVFSGKYSCLILLGEKSNRGKQKNSVKLKKKR